MKIFTIATDNYFIHLELWLKHAKPILKNHELCLIYAGDKTDKKQHELFDNFSYIKFYPKPPDMFWFDQIKMAGNTIFNTDEIIYTDCDCDIKQDITTCTEYIGDNKIGWCKSPIIHSYWKNICTNKYNKNIWEANLGFLLLKEDIFDIYNKYLEIMKKDIKIFLVGTFAFNTMIREESIKHIELPYLYSVVWSHKRFLKDAKAIQYCGNKGRKNRMEVNKNAS